MRKILKLAAFLGAAVVLFFVVVSLAFFHLVRTGEFRRYLISEIEQKTELRLQLGEADLEIGRILGISFRNVAVAESDLVAPALSAERITARVALWPLLNRRLVFYEVRLRKPDARVARDKEGKIALLERLVNLPFLKQDNGQFTFDLRSVDIVDGEIEFTDHFSETAPVTTRLHEVALVLERVRGQALREFLSTWAGLRSQQPQGAALKFKIAAGVERSDQKAKIAAQGKLVFPAEKLDLADAWYDVDARVDEMPAAMAQVYGGKLLTMKSLGGALGSQLRFEGNLKQRLRVSGKVGFERLSVEAPELFATPLVAGDGQLRLDLQWRPGQWEVSRMDYVSKDLALGVKGQARRVADGDTHLRLDFSAKPLSAAVLKKYFPARWLPSSPIDRLISAVGEGELRLYNAGVNATIAEIHQVRQSGLGERFWFDAEVRNASAKFPGEYLPLRAVDGRVALEKGRFAFSNWRGVYGQSRLTDLDGAYDYSPMAPGALNLLARGEADLGELREQAQRGILPAEFSKALLSVQTLSGKGKFDMALIRPADGAPRAEGKLALEGARLQWDKISLTDINGDLALTPTEIKTDKMRALISGSPVEARLALKNYAADDGRFDLGVDSPGVRAGIVSRLFLESGSMQDPGIVRGSVRYQGSFNDKQDRKFTGNLELFNVQLATFPLLQPLRQLNGKVSIDESGIDFKDMQGLLVGFAASANGRWRYAQKPQLIFDFTAPRLDISYLISQIDPEPTEFYATLQAEGRVTLGQGRINNFEFADSKSTLVLDRRVWRFPNLTMRAGGGAVSGPLTVVHKPDTLGITAEPKAKDVPLGVFLRWFDLSTSEITGTVDVAGKFDTVGDGNAERKRNLNGAFNLKIADGTIHRMRILVQLLNLLDLSRWFTFQLPDLGKQGIRFRAITGDFKITNGVYATENLLVDSDDLRMTGAGKIDAPKDEIDFVVAVRPFAGIDTAITQIPLLGRGIAAIKNSFLVASFNIKGRIDDPVITPAPLGTLSEMFWGVLGIPKSLIFFGGDTKDSQKEALPDQPPAPGR
jgi:uncharacterized protein involved in outer membrane biogenesis